MATLKRREAPVPLHVNITPIAGTPAACHVEWGEFTYIWPVATVRTLAADMVAAAARAEAEAATVAVLRGTGLDDTALSGFLRDVRARYPKKVFGLKAHLTLVPAVSMFDGAPFVHANVGHYLPIRITPEQLRSTGSAWTAVAVAAEHDAVLTYAMSEAGLAPDQIEAVFTTARAVYPGGLRDHERTTPAITEDTDG